MHSHQLKSHLNRKFSCARQQECDSIVCDHCHKTFSRKDNLLVHLKKKRCAKIPIDNSDVNSDLFNFGLETRIDLSKKLITLKKKYS